ncbi:MAG: M23 family metallopeptidase [Candidatus Berkelbacteria bacterium]|nr:M23 family metallopeptidase [Candidatus Berkelbacteria bacterium]
MSRTRKIFLFVVLPLLVMFAILAFWLLGNQSTKTTGNSATTIPAANSSAKTKTSKSDGPTLKIKSLGINLAPFDPATGMAGDLEFTKTKFTSGIQLLFSDFGYVIKAANSASGQDKSNPQPTFIAPLGTKVMSLVDGVVFNVPKLYSNDYSVQVYDGEDATWVYETEHIINVTVKKGDKVKAGQVVGEVSDYSAHGYDGQGLFEIGLLKGGQTPQHFCPFSYLDESIKDTTLKQLSALMKSWEEYRGDMTLYPDESTYPILGCLTLDPING